MLRASSGDSGNRSGGRYLAPISRADLPLIYLPPDMFPQSPTGGQVGARARAKCWRWDWGWVCIVQNGWAHRHDAREGWRAHE